MQVRHPLLLSIIMIYWPNSPLYVAFYKLRRMIALSPAFQIRAGIGYSDAIKRVWTEYVPTIDELVRETKNETAVQPQMPFASIWVVSTASDQASGGSQVWTIPDGSLHLYLACHPLATILDWNDRREEAMGFLDQWLIDIMNLSGSYDSGSTDGMDHLTIRKADSPLSDHVPAKVRESSGDHYYRVVALRYGDQA